LSCQPCIGTKATTFGVSIAAAVVVVLLIVVCKRRFYDKLWSRQRRRLRATLKILFVGAQVVLVYRSVALAPPAMSQLVS